MKTSFACFFIITITIFSCSRRDHKWDLETKIENEIKKTCIKKGICHINLGNIISFDWEEMYVFKETANIKQIESAIGIKYPYYDDVAKRIIFVHNNRIVYHEEVFPHVEGIINGQILFEIDENAHYKKFTDKIFEVKKISLENKKYYVLEQVQ
jgi:hypothetical protein